MQGDSSFAGMVAGQGADLEESKVSKRGKREKNTIDFAGSVVFFEDSEGDFNVLSEDEDLADATTYCLQHMNKALKCSIVPK